MNVSACLVTRGNVDLAGIYETLSAAGITNISTWNNANGNDLAVYGRYAAIAYAYYPVIFTQDDDCVLPPDSIRALLDAYQPGKLAANMPADFRPHYPDSCLVGFGAVFDRDLPQRAFDRFGGPSGRPDVVFSTLTERVLVDVPYRNLPWATGADRNYRQRRHSRERRGVLRQARRIRDQDPA